MVRTAHWILLTLLVLQGCAPRRPPRPQTVRVRSPIDTLALRAHTYFLASDLLLGRGTGTPGAEAAALYIISACRRQGLEPVGGRYAHPVSLDLVHIRTAQSSVIVVGPGSTEEAFPVGEEAVFAAGSRTVLRSFAGPVVWVGSGGEITGSPDEIPSLRGAIALTAGTIRPRAAQILRDRGAVGVIYLIDDAETFRLYVASRGPELMALSDTLVASSFLAPIPSLIVGPTAARALLLAAHAGREARVHVEADRRPIRSDNITCALRGTDSGLRDTAIAFTAHYDHLGVSVPDAAGDSIYNGFSDNAVGVAMLLAIAEAAQREPPGGFRHTLLFLFFTGEERGLLGSDYFVANAPFPLNRIRAVINLDAGAPPARPWNWRIAGGQANALGLLAMDVAASRGWSATTSPATPNSDYFPFARVGVPAVFIIPGSAPYEGLSADSSAALRRRWDRYHQPGDAWHEDFPYAGVQRYAEFAYLLARAIDR